MKPETPVSKLSRDLFGCNFSSSSDEDGQAKFKSIDDMLIDSSNESSSVASNNGHSDMHMEKEAEHDYDVSIHNDLALAQDLGIAQGLQQKEEDGANSAASSHGQSDTPMEDYMEDAEDREIDMLTANHRNAYRNTRSTGSQVHPPPMEGKSSATSKGLPNNDDDGLCTTSSEDKNDNMEVYHCQARFTPKTPKCNANFLLEHTSTTSPETISNKKLAALAQMRLVRKQQESKEGVSQLDFCEKLKLEHCLYT